MPNPWKQFKELLPDSPLLIGEVLSHNPDGTSTIGLIDGGTLRARGQSVAMGQNAFVRAGRVDGAAPDLDVVTIEI